MKDYTEYFNHYLKGEDEALRTSIQFHANELDIVVPLLQLLDKGLIKEIDKSRLDFFRYKTQATKALFLAITSTLRLHRFQAYGDIRYGLDAITISCFALNEPEKLASVFVKYEANAIKQTNYSKTHGDLSKTVFDAARKYLEQKDKLLSERIFKLKEFTSTYGSHVFYANTEFNTEIKEQAFQNVFDDPTKQYQHRLKESLIIIADIIFLYIQFLYRNAGVGKLLLNNVILDLAALQAATKAGALKLTEDIP